MSPLFVQCKCAAEPRLILYTQHLLNHDRGREFSRDPYIRRPARGGMPPPPVPIDPAIDTWRPSTITISPTLGLDNLLHCPPVVPDRLNHSNLSNLDPLSHQVHLPAMRDTSTEPNPLVRFWNDRGPWDPQRIGGDPGQTHMNPPFPYPDHRMPRDAFYDYRSPRSEVGSSNTGRYPLDSGYGGSQSLPTKSIRGADQVDRSPSRQSIAGEVRDLHYYPGDGYPDPSARGVTSPNTQYSPMDASNDTPRPAPVTFDLICQQPGCEFVSKNLSEHR